MNWTSVPSDMFPRTPAHTVHTTGNETFDKFLGGGLLNQSLNVFERQGPSSRPLDVVLQNSLAASALASLSNVVLVNFDSTKSIDSINFKESIPNLRKVKSEQMYKDVRGRSGRTHIKIAWRYYSRSSSPPEDLSKMSQIDFGQQLLKERPPQEVGSCHVINVDQQFDMSQFFRSLEEAVAPSRQEEKFVQIIFKDLISPFSPLRDDTKNLVKLFYLLRCFVRSLKSGSVLITYDVDQFNDHSALQEHIYNIADSVISFYSYETGESHLTGYKNVEGTLEYLKVPKINSFGLHFQRDLSDWGYRFTKNHKFFVVDELSLPPQDENNRGSKREVATNLTDIEHKRQPIEQVGPLEDFKKVAETMLPEAVSKLP